MVFVTVMLTGLLWNHWSFFILFSVIHFGCWVEYQKLVGLIDKGYQEISPFHKYGVMIAGWCLMLYFTNNAYSIFGFQLHEIGWWLGLIFIFVLPIVELLFAKQVLPKNIGHSAFGLVYISLSLGLMINLRSMFFELPKGSLKEIADSTALFKLSLYESKAIWICLLTILTMWVNDTMAYIVGSLIGKTQLSKISPKKTWEGTIGGIILSSLIIGFFAYYYLDPLFVKNHSSFFWITLTLIASIAGTFGDLLESKLKRMAGVKDSGHIMPGHGGFLDRFDSLLLAIPFVWLYIYFFI